MQRSNPTYRRRFRRTWVQIHLWLGLATGMVISFVCLSGSLLIYRYELEVGLNQDLYGRAEAAAPLSPDLVLRVVRNRDPRVKVQALQPVPGSSTWIVTTQGNTTASQSREIFVAPGSPPRITGDREANAGALNWIYQFHRNLLIGTAGRNINGFIALALVVLEMTGLVLWWPVKPRWRAAVRVRYTSGPRRANWDLHVLIGLWTAAPLLLFAVTGYRFCFPRTLSVPTALIIRGDIHDYGHFFRKTIPSSSPDHERLYRLQGLLHESEERCPGCTLRRIIMPSGQTGAIEIFMQPQQFEQFGGFRSYFFDRWSGDLIAISDSNTAPNSLQPLFLAGALHFGRWGGQVSRVVSFLVGIGPSVLFVTGAWMWWRRRRTHALVR